MAQKVKVTQEILNLRADILAKAEFPEELSNEVKMYLTKAMHHTSMMGIRAFDHTYRNLILFERLFRMAEMQTIIDILIGSTPVEMCHSLRDHLTMMETHVYPLRDKYFSYEKVLTDKIEKEVVFKDKITRGIPGKELYLPG